MEFVVAFYLGTALVFLLLFVWNLLRRLTMGREQRANAGRRETIRAMAEQITGRAVDDGQIIALGFGAFIAIFWPNWRQMPYQQRDDLRAAFFAGAQHLFGSVMSFLEPGQEEPTERDMRRMSMVAHELDAWVEEYKQRRGIADPDIGPPKQTEQ